jgi:hypothetical protein
LEHTTYASRLRYLDAENVDDPAVEYDDLDVRGPDGEKLGDVEGFIVDAQAGRVYYMVVDAGGWFTHNRLLLPIGHVVLDRDQKALNVDVTRDALMRYPQFDEDRFREFSDEDLRLFESRMVEACCPDDVTGEVSVRSWAFDTRNHYRQPAWWSRDSFQVERLRPVESPATRLMATTASGSRPEERPAPVPAAAPSFISPGPAASAMPREQVTAQAAEPSPHFDGRAQPGDVLGIETGGERTHVGESAEDEDRRRRTAERALVSDERSGPRTE